MRILLIANATASSVTARKRVVIKKALAADHDVELAETTRRGHATRLARAAAHEGVDVVVVLAGDGTLNEAADGLAGSETALAALPGGSTNVYAQTLGLPQDCVDATSILLQALDRKSFERIGLGVINGRSFLFHTGLGFDAAVVKRVEKRAELKRYAGHPVFVATAFATWARGYDRKHPHFDLVVDEAERISDCFFAIVSKTSPYTFLGNKPIHVAPAARIDTPLALTVFRRMDAITLLGATASAIGSGRWVSHRKGIVHRHDVKHIVVEAHQRLPYQVDGDYLGDLEHADISYRPDALTIVVP